MNRAEFMARLEQLLAGLTYEERREALNFYEDYFTDAGPEREQEVIAELGSPEMVAQEILRGNHGSSESYTDMESSGDAGQMYGEGTYSQYDNMNSEPYYTEPVRESFFRKHPFLTVLLAIPALIVGLPVVIVAASVVFVLIVTAAAVLFALAIVALTVMAVLFGCGILFFALAFTKIFLVPSVGIMMLGAGLLLTGCGILSIYLVTGSFHLIRRVWEWLGRVIRRERI